MLNVEGTRFDGRVILFFFPFTVSNFFFFFNKQGLGVFFLASLVFVYDKKRRAWWKTMLSGKFA